MNKKINWFCWFFGHDWSSWSFPIRSGHHPNYIYSKIWRFCKRCIATEYKPGEVVKREVDKR